MRIQIQGMDNPILANDIIHAVLRTDLVAVPSSFEFAVRVTADTQQHLKLNSRLYVADLTTEYVVIKLSALHSDTLKDGQPIGGIAGVAIPVGCEPLITASNKAVILRNTSFNSVYRALGAKIALGSVDVPLPYFVCFKGVLPTERLAHAMQSEACVFCLRNNKVWAIKIDELFKQEVKYIFESTSLQRVHSQALIDNQKVSVLSVDKDGSTVLGDDTFKNQQIIQRGQIDSRQIKNMSKVLMIQGTILRPLMFELQAGDLVQIGDEKMVIITSAHVFKGDGFGQGTTMMSKFWVGKL